MKFPKKTFRIKTWKGSPSFAYPLAVINRRDGETRLRRRRLSSSLSLAVGTQKETMAKR